MTPQPTALRLAVFCDGNVFYQPAAAELRRLHDENEALRADAERYRLVRERFHRVLQFEFDIRYGDSGESLQELDAAIDAARNKT